MKFEIKLDMTIMAVNTFVKDCGDPNPLIRALAVRTMGCIHVGTFEIHEIEILTPRLSEWPLRGHRVSKAILEDISQPTKSKMSPTRNLGL